MNAYALLRPVLGMLSPEVKGLIVAVVELAKGAGGFGPPSPPRHVAEWCRNSTLPGVPWQLLAAVLSRFPDQGAVAAGVAPLVVTSGLVDGVRAWCRSAGLDESAAESVLLAFLLFLARDLDADGLDALSSAFAP